MGEKIRLRRPGIEPGSQEWESCMIPLHQRRQLGRCPILTAWALIRLHLSMKARLAQSVEHETLNLRVVGSSPTLGVNVLQFPSIGHNIGLHLYQFKKDYTCYSMFWNIFTTPTMSITIKRLLVVNSHMNKVEVIHLLCLTLFKIIYI